MRADLLPCPFCEGEAHMTYVSDFRITSPRTGRRVACGQCSIQSGAFGTDLEAIAAWNTRPSQPLVEVQEPEQLARRFHEAYERLAPSFGYETRHETREFDPSSANGRLMIAVCREVAAPVRGLPLTEERIAEVTGCDPAKPLWIAILSIVRATEIAHGISSSAPGGDGEGRRG